MAGTARWALFGALLAAQLACVAPSEDGGSAGGSAAPDQQQGGTEGAKEGASGAGSVGAGGGKDEKVAAMAEARARFQAMEAERLAREAEERRRYEKETRQKSVVYGGLITLRHEETRGLLSATSFKYYHPGSSGQHQVTCQETEDGYTHWRVMPRAGQRWEQIKDVPVRGGDTVRLLNMRTLRCLHSHTGPVSPITGENEVSNFNGEQGSLDPNDNWVVKLADEGGEWKMATEVSLVHPSSSAALASRPVAPNNPRYNYTMGHQEVSGRKLSDKEKARATWTAWPTEGAPGFDRYLSVFESRQEREQKFSQPNSDPDNGPKEISIYCPQNPVVSVQDLDYNLVSEGKCFALNLQSPTFESSLTLNCDGKGKA